MILVALMGIAMSVLVYRFAENWEAAQFRGRIQLESRNRIEAVSEALHKMSSLLANLQTLYRGSEKVDYGEFQTVAQGFVARTPGVLGLAWVPKVAGVRRHEFVQSARKEVSPNFAIKQVTREGKIVPAGRDIFYFPILYVEPGAAKSQLLGLDLASDEVLRERLLHACESKSLVTTTRRRIGDSPQSRDTITMFEPISSGLRSKGADLLPPCPGFYGFLGGRFSFGIIYEQILKRYPPAGIDIMVLDLKAPPDDRMLYLHSSRTREGPVNPKTISEDSSHSSLTFSRDFRLSGGVYRVVCVPTVAYLESGHTWQPLTVAGLTMLLTLALVVYLLQNLQSARRLEASNIALDEQIKEREDAQKKAETSERRFRALFEGNRDALMVVDPDNGYFLRANHSAVELFGCGSMEDLLRQGVLALSPAVQPDGQSSEHRMYEELQRAMEHDGAFFEWTHRRADGTWFLSEVSLSKVRVDQRDVIQAAVRDITDQKRRLEDLALLASVYENSVEGIVITDANGQIERVNPGFAKITGYSSSEVVGQNPRVLKSDRHDSVFYHRMWQALETRGQWSGEIWNRRKDGEIYPEWLTVNRIADDNGRTAHYVGVFHDISDIKRSEEKLSYRAQHDHLTGLPNRVLFYDRLNMAMASAKRTNTGVGVFFLDLDNFKNVNDTLGHLAGDEVLKEVSRRLELVLRSEDTVARLGGDEFLIALTRLADPSEAVRAAQRVLDALRAPIKLGEQQVYIGGSVGISLYPQDGDDADTLIKNCDIAMYRAKNQGKNTYAVFTEAISEAVVRRFTLENELRQAMAQKSFCLHYQPKVEAATGKVVGTEALVRWQKSDGELVFPDEFIPLAEETDIIYELSPWVLNKACEDLASLHKMGHEELTVAVNLSAKQFQDKNLTEQATAVIGKYGLKARHLSFEITEHTIMTNVELAAEIMRRLSELGIKVALDDFGTGYSSLGYLSRLPLNAIKIDKSFVDDLPQSPEASVVARTIITLAHGLSFKTVAEGVSVREQLHFMQEHGCDEIQGYYFSRPLPLDQLAELLEETPRFDVS
ncbi:MAG: EAL domain-containing protein [Desulfarculaceae bacterium]|nr:EAL domain-containing protein [Desulfarculaceae bacterium]